MQMIITSAGYISANIDNETDLVFTDKTEWLDIIENLKSVISRLLGKTVYIIHGNEIFTQEVTAVSLLNDNGLMLCLVITDIEDFLFSEEGTSFFLTKKEANNRLNLRYTKDMEHDATEEATELEADDNSIDNDIIDDKAITDIAYNAVSKELVWPDDEKVMHRQPDTFSTDIYIFNQPWFVRFVKFFDPELNESGGHLYGKTIDSTKTIIICHQAPVATIYNIIMHEVTHAFIFQFLLGKAEFTSEELCEFVATYADQISKRANEILDAYHQNVLC
jgi:hypothetical protein